MALREKVIAALRLDMFSQEPMHVEHPMAALYEMDNVILFPHLTFYTGEAIARLTEDALARALEILESRPVLVKSRDPRLRAQQKGVTFRTSWSCRSFPRKRESKSCFALGPRFRGDERAPVQPFFSSTICVCVTTGRACHRCA